MEHTKGEIRVVGYHFLVASETNDVVIATTDHAKGLVDEQQMVNAKHIEMCWNCHDDLLAACRMVKNSIYQDRDGEWQLSRPAELLKTITEEAIAKAEKS